MDRNRISARQQLMGALSRQNMAMDQYLNTPECEEKASQVIQCNRELLDLLQRLVLEAEPHR